MRKGFTLIELVIVIVILGVLAAIAIPKYADMTEKTTRVAAEASSGVARSALVIYLADKGGVFPTAEQLAGYVQGATAEFSPLMMVNLKVTIGSQDCYIPLYHDKDCLTPYMNGEDTQVKCVGNIVVAPDGQCDPMP